MEVTTKVELKLTSEEKSILDNASDLLGRISDEMLEYTDIAGYDYDDIESARTMFSELVAYSDSLQKDEVL